MGGLVEDRGLVANLDAAFRPDLDDGVAGVHLIKGAIVRFCHCRRAGVGGNPARSSNWEIHPVYAIDVCEFVTASRCKWDDDSAWTPLHTWLEDE